MTVGAVVAAGTGRLIEVAAEREGRDGEAEVTLIERAGRILPNLRVGADVAACCPLRANAGLSSMGYILGGRGFVVEPDDIPVLAPVSEARALVHPLFNGKDIVARPRGLWVIDAHGLDEPTLRTRAPGLWQRLKDRVQPERAVNADLRVRERWWLFRRSNEQLREATAGLKRFIVTCETAKHRTFTMLSAEMRPEHKLVVLAVDDLLVLGVLSSRLHVDWALAAGGWLGVGNDPVYVKSACFDPFPFPGDDTGLDAGQVARIGELAGRLDAHRRTQQAAHADLTLTGMYNVLDKLRASEPLSSTERTVYDHGLVGVLRALHDELDAAVFEAYGWADLAPTLADYSPATAEAREAAVGELLQRLVDLNSRRAAEEAAGTVRWLRPEFQQRGAAGQAAIDTSVPEAEAADADDEAAATSLPAAAPVVRRPWPAGLAEQIKAVADVMVGSGHAMGLPDLEARFTARGRWRDRLPVILDTLEALGRVRRVEGAAGLWQAG